MNRKAAEKAVKEVNDANARCAVLLEQAQGRGFFREDGNFRTEVLEAIAEREHALDRLLAAAS